MGNNTMKQKKMERARQAGYSSVRLYSHVLQVKGHRAVCFSHRSIFTIIQSLHLLISSCSEIYTSNSCIPNPRFHDSTSVNGKRVLGQEFTDLVRRLQRIGRPVEFGMARNVDVDVTVNRPPLELELRRVSGRVTVTGFCEVS